MADFTPYRPFARIMHWLTAILVLLTVPAAILMLQPGIGRGLQDPLFLFHKNIGVVILVIVTLRLAYRLVNPPPPLPEHVPKLQRMIAETTHWALYVLLLAMATWAIFESLPVVFPLKCSTASVSLALLPGLTNSLKLPRVSIQPCAFPSLR
jgi:cytochrome b561